MSELTVDERRFSEIVYELGSANRSDSCIIRPDMGPDFWEGLGVIKSSPKTMSFSSGTECRTAFTSSKAAL